MEDKFLNTLENKIHLCPQESLKLLLILMYLGLQLIQGLILSWFMIKNIIF